MNCRVPLPPSSSKIYLFSPPNVCVVGLVDQLVRAALSPAHPPRVFSAWAIMVSDLGSQTLGLRFSLSEGRPHSARKAYPSRRVRIEWCDFAVWYDTLPGQMFPVQFTTVTPSKRGRLDSNIS